MSQKPNREKSKSIKAKSRGLSTKEASYAVGPISGRRPEITRIVILSSASSEDTAALTDVHSTARWATSQKQLCAVILPGIAEVEFALSDDEPDRKKARRSRHNNMFVENDSGRTAALLSVENLEGFEAYDNPELQQALASLPAEAARHIANDAFNTGCCQHACEQFKKILAPIDAALTGALLEIEPSLQYDLGSAFEEQAPPLVTAPGAMRANGSGVGHPIMRISQRFIKSSNLSENPALAIFAKILELSVSEFFRQYSWSNGTTAMNSMTELAHSCFTSIAPAVSTCMKREPSSKTPLQRDIEENTLTQGCDSSVALGMTFCQRETWLQTLHPSLLEMRSIFGATRSDSPDVHLHFLDVGIVDRSDAFAMQSRCTSRDSYKKTKRIPGSGKSRSPERRQVCGDNFTGGTSLNSPRACNSRHDQRPFSPPAGLNGRDSPKSIDNVVENNVQHSNVDSEEHLGSSPGERLTAAGARRLQFWDGFFSYRSLGAVSRELAAKQLDAEKDLEEDDPTRKYLMYHLSPNHGIKESMASTTLSAFSSLLLNDSMFDTSITVPSPTLSPRSPRSTQSRFDIMFPALDQRRKHVHLKTLRRPPGATAEPPERFFESRHTSANNEGRSPVVTARTPLKGQRELPPLVATSNGARLASRTQVPSGLGNQLREVPSSRLASPELSKESIVKDPLSSPMFMNVANDAKDEHVDMPFDTNGVGFEVQPLSIAKARRVAQNEARARVADKADELRREISRRWSSSTSVVAVPTARRCQYCIHHNIHPTGGSNAMAAKWEQKACTRQRACAQLPGVAFPVAPIHLCAACGEDTDSPFTPRAPKLLVEAAQGTPLELASSNVLARIRSPGLVSSRPQRAVRASIAEIPKATSESAANIGAQFSSNSATEGGIVDEVSTKTSSKRHAGFAYGLPKRVLSDSLDINKVAVGNVYFVACEKNRARPLPEGPVALTESGALVDISTNNLRIYADPQATQTNQGEDIYISLRGADLDDSGLAAFIESLTQKGAEFEGVGIHIDLARNRLTDSGVHRFLSSLEEPLGWVRRLETLDFARNRLLTASAIEPLSSLLSAEKLPRLRTLRLGGIELTESFALRLFKGIDAASSGNLEELDISFLGLGRSGPAAPAAAADLIRQCQALCTLDVSGNHLNIDAICAIGHALSEVSYVQTLHFAHNTGNWPVVVGSVPDKQQDFLLARQSNPPSSSAGIPHPFEPQPCTAMCGLWGYLSKIPALRVLDLRDAQIDPRCAFMLACSVFEHKNLEAILLNGNPLGVYGVRALLAKAYLAQAPPDVSETHLSVLTLDQCDEGSMLALDVPSMSLADPSGSYVFDLRDPWSGTAVQDCLNQWKTQTTLAFDQVFPSIEIDGKVVKEIASSPDGTWDLPRSGVISFTCLLPRSKQPSGETHTFRSRPQDHHRQKLSPELEQRALRIAATCHSLLSLQVLVQALAADFWLRGVVVKTLCHWMSTMGSAGTIAQTTAAELLSDCVIDAECDMELLETLSAPKLTPSPSSLRKHYCVFDYVSLENPTGHYVLNLAWPSERILAEDFLLLSSWEAEVAKTSNLPDRSQFGNYQYLRNEAMNAKGFVYKPDWVLPTSGMLEFDFSLPRQWPKTAKTIGEETWKKLKTALTIDETPAMMKALCLRRVSSRILLTCQQALSIFASMTKGIGLSAGGKRGFPSPVEMTLLCVLIFRIKDYQNTRVTFFKNTGPFGSIERLKRCEYTLGCLNIADPLHINTELRLNLDVHEERQYCRMVLNIAFQEGGRTLDPKSFAVCAYGPDTTPELLRFPSGAPPDRWMKTGLPRRGVLALMYIVEDGNAKFRRRQAQLVCGWES